MKWKSNLKLDAINKYCFHYSDTIPSIEPVTLPHPSLLPLGIVERERDRGGGGGGGGACTGVGGGSGGIRRIFFFFF